MLSTEDLALLEAIRETGSLSRAAAHLGKAPSTVSYAARQLEERFDALLFDRRRYRYNCPQRVNCWSAKRRGAADARPSVGNHAHVPPTGLGHVQRLVCRTDQVLGADLGSCIAGTHADADGHGTLRAVTMSNFGL
jgi:hypothetical protein